MSRVAPPWVMLAELTHRCPLHCAYCSNSINLNGREGELETEEWVRVFRQAAELGIAQLQLSGGEPLLREDLDTLISGARELDPQAIESVQRSRDAARRNAQPPRQCRTRVELCIGEQAQDGERKCGGHVECEVAEESAYSVLHSALGTTNAPAAERATG